MKIKVAMEMDPYEPFRGAIEDLVGYVLARSRMGDRDAQEVLSKWDEKRPNCIQGTWELTK